MFKGYILNGKGEKMSKAEHTPGPWQCHSGMVWSGPLDSDQYATVPIARMDRDTPATAPTERDANARLIAAAPDLLAAAKLVLASIWGPEWERKRVETTLRTAIAKAKGE